MNIYETYICWNISVDYKKHYVLAKILFDLYFVLFYLFHFSARQLLLLNINVCIAGIKQKAKGANYSEGRPISRLIPCLFTCPQSTLFASQVTQESLVSIGK